MEILAGSPVRLTYDAGSAEELAARVQAAAQDYPRLTEWSLRRARDFTDEEVVRKAEALFMKLSSARG